VSFAENSDFLPVVRLDVHVEVAERLDKFLAFEVREHRKVYALFRKLLIHARGKDRNQAQCLRTARRPRAK